MEVFMIHKDTTIEEIVNKYPQLIKPLREYGIKCIMCGEPIWGTLEENAKEKGIGDQELDEIIVELNKIIQNKS